MFVSLGIGPSSTIATFVLVGLTASGPSAQSSAVGSFTRRTTTGTQSIVGTGFQPKAVLLFSTNADGFGFADGLEATYGLSDGVTSVTTTARSEDAAATTDVHRSYREGYVDHTISASGTLLSRAALVSFDPDGFTVTWDTNDGVASEIHYVAFGGTAVTAKVGVYDSDTSDGPQSITGVGFQPTAVLGLGAWATATSETSDFFSLGLSWMAPSATDPSVISGGAANISIEDGASASNTSRYQRVGLATAGLKSGISGGVGDVYFDALPVSFDSDGFTIEWDPSNPVSVGRYYLALGGITARCGAVMQPTSPGVQSVVTRGVGVSVMLTMSVGDLPRTTPQAEARWWFGAGSLQSSRGIYLADTDAADPTVCVRRNVANAMVLAASPSATAASSSVLAEALWSGGGAGDVQWQWTQADAVGREVLFLAFGESIPDGGGTMATGTNPPTATVPTGVLRYFVTLKVGSTTYAMAETSLFADPPSYFGGPKSSKLIEISDFSRELRPSGEFSPVTVSVRVADTDRTFRTLANTATITGGLLNIYLVSDADRYALTQPYRRLAAIVTEHGPIDGLQYEFTAHDVLSARLAVLDATPKIPPDRLSVTQFAGIDPELEGKAAPWLIGRLTDHDQPNPQGVVPPLRLGGVNFQATWGGSNIGAVACILGQGAIAQVWDGYYNPPDTPDTRLIIPGGSYGPGGVFVPYQANWSLTGNAANYAEYPTVGPEQRRYTPFFVDESQSLAQAFKDKRVLVGVNCFGVTPNADGTGNYISDPPDAWQFILQNLLFTPYRTGAYAAIPSFDGVYSAINTDSVLRTRTRQHARLTGGYTIAFILGHDGQQQTARHVLTDLCEGTDMEQGIDRHGRLMVDTEDASAAAVATLTDRSDIENGTFSLRVDRSAWFDRIETSYARRYVAPSAPHAAPTAGEALPEHVAAYNEWGGFLALDHTAAIAANGGVPQRTKRVENAVVRLPAVAADVATRQINRAVGFAPSYDGPRVFALTVPLARALAVELGDNATLTHVDGLGANGFSLALARTMKLTESPKTRRITVEGYMLEAG